MSFIDRFGLLHSGYGAAALLYASAAIGGCGGNSADVVDTGGSTDGAESGGSTDSEPTRFRVEIENISNQGFLSAGVFDRPVGSDEPGPALPGGSYAFEFDAAPGHRLSFATMFVQSNDWFYAPAPEGIELFGPDGTPLTGDITNLLQLWDAGTEVDEVPGAGPNQPPRSNEQLDLGEADPDDTVRTVDLTDLPAVEDVVRAELTVTDGFHFTLTVENVSTPETLVVSPTESVPVPLAPGVWVVHDEGMPLFTTGEADRGAGLEALAEDGTAAELGQSLESQVSLATPLSPGVWAVHKEPGILFEEDAADAGDGLESLAEDGAPDTFLDSLSALSDAMVGAFDTPEGADAPNVILAGERYTFEVEAAPGYVLSLATMYVQSNDLFFAPSASGIPLFEGDTPRSGDVSAELLLWDAGTEENEPLGVGPNQPPRQAQADTGPDEAGIVTIADEAESVDTESVLRVTVTPL